MEHDMGSQLKRVGQYVLIKSRRLYRFRCMLSSWQSRVSVRGLQQRWPERRRAYGETAWFQGVA